jgi:hypothetical protein
MLANICIQNLPFLILFDPKHKEEQIQMKRTLKTREKNLLIPPT